MKSFFLFLSLVLSFQFSYAQSWRPFILGQKSYYKLELNDVTEIETFKLDSTRQYGDSIISYFNYKSDIKQEYYDLLIRYPELTYGNINPNRIDSIISCGGVDIMYLTTIYGSPIDSFIFKSNAKVNESWITNGLEIKCTAFDTYNILGIVDSVKIFSCGSYEFILSKHFGFVKFFELNGILNPLTGDDGYPNQYEIIGYVFDTISVGYKQPGFKDYFHLQKGDVLYWKKYNESYDITIKKNTSYWLDTITYSYISEDSVYYEYKRNIYDENKSYITTKQENKYHLKNREGAILSNPISWFGPLLNSGWGTIEFFYLDYLHLEINESDTTSCLSYLLPGIMIDTIESRVNMMFDYGTTTRYSTRAGHIFTGSYSWGEHSTTLLGSIIDGDGNGDTNFPTSMNQFAKTDISVYPNPFNNYININSNQNVEFVEMFDCQGCLVLSQSNKLNRLNLRHLKQGIYILKVRNESGLQKLVRLTKN